MNRIKEFVITHKAALLLAFIVGTVYIAPYLFFIFEHGDNYQGIPIIAPSDEDFYLSRMREVVEGSFLVGSHAYFEYKDEFPIIPPVGEFLYALPSLVFGTSLESTLIASKFVLPFILFLLVYLFIYKLIAENSAGSNRPSILAIGTNRQVSLINKEKASAIAGALLVTLGYDLVDYHTVFGYITGATTPVAFLIWARPIHPILGGIFLFGFLIFLWSVIMQGKRQKLTVVGAAISLALMFTSYFFSWGTALSVLFVLILIYTFKRKWHLLKKMLLTVALALLFSLPYWYIAFQAKKSEWFESSVLRAGLLKTHVSMWNLFLLAILLVYIVFVVLPFIKKILKRNKSGKRAYLIFFRQFRDWHWFILSLVAGSLIAFNQQIITGITAWPFHFVQYSIPLGMIVLVILWHRVFRSSLYSLWMFGVLIIIFTSAVVGLFVQAVSYKNRSPYYSKLQSVGPVFKWLDENSRDGCVVLAAEKEKRVHDLNLLVPAFTSCDVYAAPLFFSLMPDDRALFSYLVNTRLKEITVDDLEEFLKRSDADARGYLYSNWSGLFGISVFSDFPDDLYEKRLKAFPEDYQKFLTKDFKKELSRYRLDYILSEDPLSQSLVNELELALVFESGSIYVYSLD